MNNVVVMRNEDNNEEMIMSIMKRNIERNEEKNDNVAKISVRNEMTY